MALCTQTRLKGEDDCWKTKTNQMKTGGVSCTNCAANGLQCFRVFLFFLLETECADKPKEVKAYPKRDQQLENLHFSRWLSSHSLQQLSMGKKAVTPVFCIFSPFSLPLQKKCKSEIQDANLNLGQGNHLLFSRVTKDRRLIVCCFAGAGFNSWHCGFLGLIYSLMFAISWAEYYELFGCCVFEKHYGISTCFYVSRPQR